MTPRQRRALLLGAWFAIGSLTVLVYCAVVIAEHLRGILQWPPQLEGCSVAFELTPSYATSAFSCESGPESIKGPTVSIEGNNAYRHSMFRLSTNSSYRLGADDASNMSTMFSRLVEASAQRVHSYIHSATLAYPRLTALVADNIEHNIMRKAFEEIDAASFVAYEQILHSSLDRDNDLHASHAILAGHGIDTYLLAAYYSYGVEIVLTEETTSVYDVQSYTYNNYSLGFRSKPSDDGEQAYWDNVQDFVRTALLDHPGLKPRTLILYGDKCIDKDFQAVLNQVLNQVLGREDLPRQLLDGVDSTFAGAIGAADLLKRKKYRKLCWE
ncbi:hypothetical protein Slin14017_G084730 [Septoria linicola]|nr:hypothetical protein Slin14017_G084730 [Septoria linicola]